MSLVTSKDHMGRELKLDVSAPFVVDNTVGRILDEHFVPDWLMKDGGVTLTNLIKNPSGVANTTGYFAFATSGTSGGFTRVDDPTALSGSALQFVINGMTGGSALIAADLYTSAYPNMVAPGDNVLYRARIKVTAATGSVTSVAVNRRLSIEGTSAVFDQANVALQLAPALDTWYEIAGTSTMPATTSQTNMDARIAVAAGSYTFRVERFQMVVLPPGQAAPAYFDGTDQGDMVPRGWSGTPHASTSWAVV